MQLGMIGLGRMGVDRGDILIDGGNSYYIDDIRRAKELGSKGIHYVDVTATLYERFSSRGEAEFVDRLVSAMRSEFGGHIEKPAGK